MSGYLNIIKILLLGPLSALYGIIVWLRNFFYDNKIYKSKEYGIPIISLGNISVGGTGKTPHTEYLVNMLKSEFQIAVLSRGYKRKTSGFRIVEINSTALESGDEPLQIKLKFPEIIVAVDGNRRRGIENLLEMYPSLNLIILDDAFQHRKVKPGLSILLNNFSHPISKDYLLPLGRLREGKDSAFRAHIIIITKCPSTLKPIERRIMNKEMDVLPFQYLFFSHIKYLDIKPVFPEYTLFTEKLLSNKKGTNALLITGIAHPNDLVKHLESQFKKIVHLKFSDHRNFTKQDISSFNKYYNACDNPKIIITTEKDMVRFSNNNIVSEDLKSFMYYIPIEVELLASEEEKKQFDNQIFSYVRNNKRYSKLYKGTN